MDHKAKHSSKGESFIKVLDHDFKKHLEIPQDFSKIFKGYMPHRFILESTIIKNCWRVEVEVDGDGRMYLREGWNDFAQAHSLEVGNFLVFEYGEQSIFQVTIYGRNGCEKLSPLDDKLVHEELKKTKKSKVVVKVEDHKYHKTVSEIHQDQVEILSPRQYERGIQKMRAVSRTTGRPSHALIRSSSNGFSITLNRKKRHQFVRMGLPRALSQGKNFSGTKTLRFRNTNGNCWWVNLSHSKDGRATLCKGWTKFLVENGIVGGEKLKFEFVSDNLFQVRVTKASEVPQTSQTSEETKSQDEMSSSLDIRGEDDELVPTADDKAIEPVMATESQAGSSSFSFTWRNIITNIYYLYIPKNIAMHNNLMTKDKVVLRDPGRKCWPVEVSKWSDGRMAFRKGWREFWKGNDIKTGDCLSLEFVSEYLIQVNITRGESAGLQLAVELEGDVINPNATGNYGSEDGELNSTIKAETSKQEVALLSI